MHRRTVGITTAATIIASLYALLIFYVPERLCDDCSRDGKGVRFFADDFDRSAYFVRGMWYVFGLREMAKLDAEYPPVAVYFFALPFIIADIAGKNFAFYKNKPVPEAIVTALQSRDRRLYTNLFTVLMVPLYAALLYVIFLIRLTIKEEFNIAGEGVAVLFFLPAFMYFSFNRFDVLPSLVVCLAMLALLSDKSPVFSGALLGIGMMTKWYPALLAPVFFKYYFGKDSSAAGKFAVSFVCAVLVVLLPFFFCGEWGAFLNPYRFQLGRQGDVLSLFGLFAGFLGMDMPRWAQIVLLVLQFCPSLLALTAEVKNKRAVLEWTLFSLFSFVFFAKFYSPQWLIWIVPLLAVKLSTPRLLFLAVLWDISSYLLFPVFYDVYGVHDNFPPVLFSVFVVFKSVVIILLAAPSAKIALRDLRESWGMQKMEQRFFL